MIYGYIMFFSLFLFLKTILIHKIYTNEFLFLYYPIELAITSIKNNSIFNILVNWIFLGNINILNLNKMNNLIKKNKIIEFEENDYNIILLSSWGISYILILFYLKFKNKKINFYKNSLKLIIINYSNLYLNNLEILVSLNKFYFWVSLINIYIFNIVTFWVPGLICNFIYGNNLYIYRTKYSFLLKKYNLKYKYFTLVLLLLKILIGSNIIVKKLYSNNFNYDLVIILLIFIYIVNKKNIFNDNKIIFYLNIQNILCFILIIIAIINNYVNILLLDCLNYFCILLMISVIIVFYVKKLNKTNITENYELNIL